MGHLELACAWTEGRSLTRPGDLESRLFAAAGMARRVDRGRPAPPIRRFGRYRLIARLGRGRQAQVFKAVQLEPIVETVALKALSPALAIDPRRLAQFHREAEVGAQLSSPSLLPTYEFGETNGITYMTMPLVNGHSLATVIASAGRGPGGTCWWRWLSEEAHARAMARVLARIARALQVAHTGRIVHRDIKPANILLDRDREDRVYLCDFGLSRDLDGPPPLTTLYGTGTPLYMAPEKLAACVCDDTRCDIYALGVTLFEAVTRAHPFTVPEGLPATEWAAFLARATPSTPRAVNPRLPRSLEAIILKSMHRNPSRRHESAAALAADLEEFARSGRPG